MLTSVHGMCPVRRATAADAAEVIRLRQVVIDSVFSADTPPSSRLRSSREVPPPDWHAESLPTVRKKLADPDGDFAALVVDHPDRPGALAALAVGTVEYRIGRSGNPHGSVGYVWPDPSMRLTL